MRSKPRVTLVHNRAAGGADHHDRELVVAMQAAGYEVASFDVAACDIARVADNPTDLIAVAGGDGTVRKVALAVRRDGPPIAILPLGTANNIATSLGVGGAMRDLIAGWADPSLRKFHPIEMEAPWGSQRLIEGIGLGIFARLIDEADDKPSAPEARKRLAETARRAQPEALDLRVGDTLMSGDVVLLEITTITLVGPNLRLAPAADPSDQLIDACWVPGEDVLRMAEWLELEPAAGAAPAPVSVRSAGHITLRVRSRRLRLDDEVRTSEADVVATISLASAREPLYFVVPKDRPNNR